MDKFTIKRMLGELKQARTQILKVERELTKELLKEMGPDLTVKTTVEFLGRDFGLISQVKMVHDLMGLSLIQAKEEVEKEWKKKGWR